MASFEVVRPTTLSVDAAWRRLTDWERHGKYLPFTTVVLSDPAHFGVGTAFVARTSLGPFSFDDPMEVTQWRPPTESVPGVCQITKRGRVVVGWARLTVTAAPSGAVARWREEARFRSFGRLLDWPTRVIGTVTFGRLVDGLLRGG